MLIPASIAAYVHDAGIRRAVNELLELSDKKVLEGLSWSELARFYRAHQAARQLESEWALFGLAAWDMVWGGLLAEWTALSPDEQDKAGHEAGMGLASLRDTGDDSLWFGRVFTKGSWTLYASLSAIPAVGLRIKVSCSSSNRSMRFGDIATAADEIGNWVPALAVPLNTEALDSSSLRELACRAVEIADRSRKPGARAEKSSFLVP